MTPSMKGDGGGIESNDEKVRSNVDVLTGAQQPFFHTSPAISWDTRMEHTASSSSSAAAATAPAAQQNIGHTFSTSLEGLRGLAVLFTLTSHVLQGYDLFREVMGMMGVTIFFVLSGHLITGVLIRLQEDNGQKTAFQKWRLFHSDRAVRLVPALFLMVAFTTVLRAWMGGDMDYQHSYSLLALFSLSNFPKLWPRHGWGGPFANTWTLACEEQFYFFWSLLLPVIYRSSKTRRPMILTLLLASSFTIRIYTGVYRPDFAYGLDWHYGLLSNVWKILLGTTLSLCPPSSSSRCMLLLRGRRGSAEAGRMGAYLCLACLCLLPFLGHLYGTRFFAAPLFPDPKFEDMVAKVTVLTDPLSAFFSWLLVAWLAGGGDGEGRESKQSLGLLEWPMMRYAGRISYAWYLWQFPLWAISGYNRGYSAIGDTCIAFVAASISTFYVEEPIRRRYKAYQKRKSNSTTDINSYTPLPTIDPQA